MDFYAVLDEVLELLRHRGRVTYRALKVQFQLDDEQLEALKDEILHAQQVAVDEDHRVLVWTGGSRTASASAPAQQDSHTDQPTTLVSPAVASRGPEAERRQLTVLFCDLVDSTALASQLDPEEWREVVRAYQETCARVIARFEGYIAQYLGDGLLVYFGYPLAHEDDVQRALRAGLGMVDAMGTFNARLTQERGFRLAIRVGIHTGLVVVGEMGGDGRHEQLALGDTPNVAARLQGLAEPDTMLISAATHRLVQGYFTFEGIGPQPLKGVAAPMLVYRILGTGAAESRLDVGATTGLMPLVGRDPEVALLLEHWAQSRAGLGQVVLLSGEGGIGKSRLVEVLRERVVGEGSPGIVLRCSAYHTHSALYPVIAHLQRVLAWRRDETPAGKLDTLERTLQAYGLAPDEVVPLVVALLSVPIPEGRYPPLLLTPQQQRQQTMDALVAWLLAQAEQQAMLAVWEDLHWADPSTLELLGLIIDQAPTARLLTLITYRPEFRPPWAPRSHLTQLTVGRLPRPQVETIVRQLTGGKPLPAEVLAQVVAKTDGVPLFVEELVKMLLESSLVREEADGYALTGPLPPPAIPATLQDSLMARLDRLATVKAVAQLGATIGRMFAYELMQAVSPLDEATLQQGLRQLVEAELVYQRGVPPQATYTFKHALIQDAAYQSLLKSTRQQYHQRIAQTLVEQFPDLIETQPEVLAQHCTAAGLIDRALRYRQQAGQRAHARAAHAESVIHLTQGLALLATLPDGPELAQQELPLQLALGPPLMVTKGFAAPEVGVVYARARELCQQVEETPQLFRVLRGLFGYYEVQAEVRTAREIAAQLFHLAQRLPDPTLFVEPHRALGEVLYYLGEFSLARQHLEQGLALYTAEQHHRHAILYGQDPGVGCLTYLAVTLWLLGYPDQALARSQQALTLAQQRAHPFSLIMALSIAAGVYCYRREPQAVQERAEATLALAREYGFTHIGAVGMILQGWALAEQALAEAGMAQIHQGLAAHQETGAKLTRPFFLTLLAEVYRRVGQPAEGLRAVAEALAAVQHTGVCHHEVEMYRLQGELCLQASVQGRASGESDVPWVAVETCFRQALDVARHQQAKSLELWDATSLSRLWQRQGKATEARALLAPIYSWFTEGFDTADLQEAKSLLDELA
jgi:class 3 adenylate cyclase/predicted ATPase